ncbi:MAG TPA: hypothetical protein VKY26_01160 [Actinomycetota bacterium]|nr:hypothetical protein [Actinomycetota bacterium]
MAIVAEGNRGRTYLGPNEEHERIALSAMPPDGVPDTGLPEHALGFRVQAYGMTHHRDLFTNRQLVALCHLSDLVTEARDRVVADGGGESYADAIATYLGLALSRLTDVCNALCLWSPGRDQTVHLFGRQAIAMVWDHAENNVFNRAGGDYGVSLKTVARVLDNLRTDHPGLVGQIDATAIQASGSVVYATDPPYYDNIGYADLSDFFYVWLRRALNAIHPNLFGTILVPKRQELVADPFRHNGDKRAAESHFELGLGAVFKRMQLTQSPGFPLTVIYGFKQTEEVGQLTASTGWETMLQGLIDAGLAIVGTWPIRSERPGRLRETDSNALASSITLVCRSRSEGASLANRRDFLGALKAVLPKSLRDLQQGNVAPVDLAQAAIGPGMGVFSSYAKVVEADGSTMSVRTALGLINQILDETLSEQEGDFDADTRWALAWFEDVGMSTGTFGRAETLSKAKNTSVSGLVTAGFLESKGGKVRLLGRNELSDAWDPALDGRVTVWEVAQHLSRALDSGGEEKAADLLLRVGGLGETARELAYRLYVICERRKWAKEALAYNSLVVAWPEIVRLAGAGVGPTQEGML